MAILTTTSFGTGFGAANTDIVEKDLEMEVSNLTKDATPFSNMAFQRSRKIGSIQHAWTLDVYRKPGIQARIEAAPVSTNDIPANTRGNLYNFTQIFQTTVGNSGSARAAEMSGGDPEVYQVQKQLVEMQFDLETQLIRNDQIGTKYAGQSGTAAGGGVNAGRRMGSLASFAGTQSFNTTAGTAATMNSLVNNENTDVTTSSAGLTVPSDGSTYYTGTFTNQGFSPLIYKQMITTAQQRFASKTGEIYSPTSLRTILSDQFTTSRSINRVDASKGDTITTFMGDFDTTYNLNDSWIMDSTTSTIGNSIYFVNPDVVQWGAYRHLGPNTDVVSNADASLEQYLMEGTLIVRNPAGVSVLNNIAFSATPATSARDSSLVQRTNTGRLSTY